MTREAIILRLVHEAIDVVNEGLPPGAALEKAPEVTLFGVDGRLDSLGLVELLAETEVRLEEEFSVSVSLVNDKALSQRNSPFRSVGSLVTYVTDVVATEAPVSEAG
ncbi:MULTISPECIES: acyl carrier protein [Streptomyces]|uniref:Carrier domain-containing protein n=2 Tax=Streptomyces TaxID=1883 RepID=A0A918LBH8_9ACTN|nr:MULTISPECIES: acyl carrier protein [Streptomyces]KUN75410.1 hypothetical protein AQJ64_42645 [Streptomyces griseoruber]GGS28226.1 hypothetical protein GCM10010269_78610 [Streptomyces humidus]